MVGITEDIWKYAPIETPYGNIPTLNFEVCGDMLQASARMYWFTGERKYLDCAIRLGDYFLLGTNHPTRDLKQLRLCDHGCEVINGLTELYVAVAHALPEKKAAYEEPMHEIFDCILAKGRNPDGMLYTSFNPQTGEHAKDLCDTWGYDYDGVYTMWLVDRTESLPRCRAARPGQSQWQVCRRMLGRQERRRVCGFHRGGDQPHKPRARGFGGGLG